MNISKDGKTLYFSNEEIDHDTSGEKKVFVTKRINGKESHVNAKEIKKNKGKHIKQEKQEQEEEIFNFNHEIVIGVNQKEESKNPKKEKKRNQKNRKNNLKKEPPKNSNQKNQKKTAQKRKTRKVSKKILAFFTSILIIAIVVLFALTAPIFQITEIQVQGNQKVDTETIISLAGLKKGENIFRFNNSIIQNIKENTYIESAKITRKLPGTVIISVEEREVKYQINFINSYAYVDKNGYILENSTVKKEVPVLVRFIGNRRANVKERKTKKRRLRKTKQNSQNYGSCQNNPN